MLKQTILKIVCKEKGHLNVISKIKLSGNAKLTFQYNINLDKLACNTL